MAKISNEVLDLLQQSEGHMTAEDLFLLAKEKNIDISLASIYRVLKKMSEEGMINKIAISGQPDIFDKTIAEHSHMICQKCGKVEDIWLEGLKKEIEDRAHVKIEGYNLIVDYICEDCKD